MDKLNDLNDSGIHILELTKKLSELRQNGFCQTRFTPIRYEMEGGVGWGYPLFKSPTMACQRIYMPTNTVFPLHSHPAPSKEWIITVSGCFTLINCPQADTKCVAGDIVTFQPEEPHSCRILKPTWTLCITIPADMEEYPDVT